MIDTRDPWLYLVLGGCVVNLVACAVVPWVTVCIAIAGVLAAVFSLGGRAPWPRMVARDLVVLGMSVAWLAIGTISAVRPTPRSSGATQVATPTVPATPTMPNPSPPDPTPPPMVPTPSEGDSEPFARAIAEVIEDADQIDGAFDAADRHVAQREWQSVRSILEERAAVFAPLRDVDLSQATDGRALRFRALRTRFGELQKSLAQADHRIGLACWEMLAHAVPESPQEEERVMRSCARSERVSLDAAKAAYLAWFVAGSPGSRTTTTGPSPH